MALKYTLSVNSQKNQNWLVEIDVPGYTGDPIELVGDQNPILIEWDGGSNDNPFDNHIIPQSATFRVWSDGLDIEELQLISDGSVKCRVYLEGQLKHQGYLVSDGIQEPDSGVSSLVTIKSIDGLSLLDNIKFRWGDNYGTITVNGVASTQRCPMNVIRLALYRFDQLDNVLPIRWATSLRSEQYPSSDMLAGLNTIIKDGKLFEYSDYSTYWYLNNILKTANCWMYQRDGYWWIENREDTIRNHGWFIGYEITTSTINQVATVVTIELNTVFDLENEFILQDQYWMTKKPLGGVNVVYNDTTNRDNALPNGDFNATSVGYLLDWDFDHHVDTDSGYEIQPSLMEREGNSVQLTNDGAASSYDLWSYKSELPIDTKILYKSFLFGFTFMPSNFGFPYNEDGTISWDSKPLKIRVFFYYKDTAWYLNEFGYWQYLPVEGYMYISDFTDNISASRRILEYWFRGYPLKGDSIELRMKGGGGAGTIYKSRVTVEESDEGNLLSVIQKLSTDMIVPGGLMSVTDLGSSVKLTFSAHETVTNNGYYVFSGKDTIESDLTIPITVDSMKVNDIATVAFQGKGGNSEILFPQIENFDNANGRLGIDFFVQPGQMYTLDDVYIKVPENHDKYELRVSGSKATIDDYEVGISSSFSGFKWSNYMNDYSQSNLALLWRRFGATQGKTLTQLYGELILDWRRLPRKVFDGSIDRIVQAGDFLTIKGKKYMVMNASVQGDGITKVLAFEAVLSPTTYNVTHKGTLENNN